MNNERTDASIRDQLNAEGIKKIVWEGAYVSTDEDRVIRGSVGRTHEGDFKTAEVTLYQERGPAGRVSFSAEDYRWDRKRYAHKEQAIFAARSRVAQTVEHDRQGDPYLEESPTAKTSAAIKYASNSAPQREITPPSRSR